MRASTCFAAVVCLLAATPARAATLHVCPDGSGDYPHLRAAVAAAASGDEIELCDGVFQGEDNLDIDVGSKSLTFRSLNGRDATTIDAEVLDEVNDAIPHRCFVLGPGSSTRIEGITMLNAFTLTPLGATEGGTIHASGASLVLVGVRIQGPDWNRVDRGGKVFVQSGDLLVEDSEFLWNRARSDGGGIYSTANRTNSVRCQFRGNYACNSGGAVYMDSGSLTDCTFGYETDSRADLGGPCGGPPGGLVRVGGSVTILRCRFVGGYGHTHGGLLAEGDVLIGSCVFEDCGAEGVAGAAQFFGNVTVRNTTFRRNYGPFEGTDIASYGTTLLDHCTFSQSYVSGWGSGSGIYARGQLTVSHCVFVDQLGSGETIDVRDGAQVVIENSILALGYSLAPVRCTGTPASLEIRCTDIFGNAGGDWTGCIAGMAGVNGNLSADPLFCSVEQEEYSIHAESPCAAENSAGCGLIGTLGAWCGPTAVESSSWGSIKALYR